MKKFFLFIWEVLKIVVISLAIVIPIRYFLFQPFLVRGVSMEPSFYSGDYLIVDQLSYRFRSPERGEVIVFTLPKNSFQRYIKRIIGLPNETIKLKGTEIIITLDNGKKTILDEADHLIHPTNKKEMKITLGDDEYFVLGDNRAFSSDSRIWGALPRESIIGRVFFRVWPFTNMGTIKAPNYY